MVPAVGPFRVDEAVWAAGPGRWRLCWVPDAASVPGGGRWERSTRHMAGYGCNQRCN